MVSLLPSEPTPPDYPDDSRRNRPAAHDPNPAARGSLAGRCGSGPGRLGRAVRAATVVVAGALVLDARASAPRAAGVAPERAPRVRAAARGLGRFGPPGGVPALE